MIIKRSRSLPSPETQTVIEPGVFFLQLSSIMVKKWGPVCLCVVIFLITIEILPSSLLPLFYSFFGKSPSSFPGTLSQHPLQRRESLVSEKEPFTKESFRDVAISFSSLWTLANSALGWAGPLLVEILVPFTFPSF